MVDINDDTKPVRRRAEVTGAINWRQKPERIMQPIESQKGLTASDSLGFQRVRVYPKFFAAIVSGLMAVPVVPCLAEDTTLASDKFISSWLAMVGRTQDEQPHWITPLVTGTPRLEQEFR